ncbi:MAG: hypothetical protein HYZ28_04695 [Myxococcales bacterium]|nr:hypothetical protein [Myxococcales bacterium]
MRTAREAGDQAAIERWASCCSAEAHEHKTPLLAHAYQELLERVRRPAS